MDFVVVPPIPEEAKEMEEAWIAVDGIASMIRVRAGYTTINMKNGMYIGTPLAPQEIFTNIISIGSEPQVPVEPDRTPIPDSIFKSMNDPDEDDDNMLA